MWGAPVALGRALRLKGRLHGGERGTNLLRESVDVLRASANELELARSLALLARRLDGSAEAAALLREAGVARRGLRCAVAGRAGRAGPWYARPAARGRADPYRTDRGVPGRRRPHQQEIAGRLGVTSRAVEKHLTHAYRKLAASQAVVS